MTTRPDLYDTDELWDECGEAIRMALAPIDGTRHDEVNRRAAHALAVEAYERWQAARLPKWKRIRHDRVVELAQTFVAKHLGGPFSLGNSSA